MNILKTASVAVVSSLTTCPAHRAVSSKLWTTLAAGSFAGASAVVGSGISHLLATLAGVFLLFIARGLHHRLDGAWWLALTISAASAALSLGKGLAFDETAAIAFLVLLLLAANLNLRCRRHS